MSVGAAFELFPIGTEAVSEAFLTDARNALQVALIDALPEDATHPWVLQLYLQDDYDLTSFRQAIASYGVAEARQTPYANAFRALFDAHLERISKPDGVFLDELVSNAPWRGKIRRIRATLYQRVSARVMSSPLDQEQRLSEVAARFEKALEVVGVANRRLDLRGFREWLLPWFNPKPACVDANPRNLLDIAGDAPDPLPLWYDVGQDLLYAQTRSDQEHGVWWFDEVPHQVVSVQGIT